MAGQYPYPPPPPPPPSAAPVNGYSPYGQGQGQAFRGGSHTPNSGGGRGRNYNQGPNRTDYGASYGGYPQQEYPPQSSTTYGPQSHNAYWAGSAAPQSAAPLPQSSYPPNYSAQSYGPQAHGGYPQSAYPTTNQRTAYPPSYSPPAPEYPAQQWSGSGSPFQPYSNRGGRGGYSGDRGGHRTDGNSSMMRPAFDANNAHTTQASNGYGQSYPPPHAPYAPVPSYPSTPAYSAYPPPPPAPTHTGHTHNQFTQNRGRGRDGFSGHSRGRPGHHNDRGHDKFRHNKSQRPQHDHQPGQKSDPSSSKKKKRKTNTLGLTPGDGDESDDSNGPDEETNLGEIIGPEFADIDMAAWISERRANFPTKARIEAKKVEEESRRVETTTNKLDPDEERAEKLRRQLAKVERKLEKRKREANDEGDDVRGNVPESDSSESEDEEPETQSTKRSTFLPPPPITRADPANHCKYYSTGGICGKKGKCRFVHDPAVREQALQEQAANGGRMTLKQRLLRNDKEHDDQDVLQAIVYMRGLGKLPAPARKATTTSSATLPAKPSFL